MYDTPTYRYLISEFSFDLNLIPENDIKSLTEKIEYYIKYKPEPNWAHERDVIKKLFDFESKADQYFNIYQTLLESKIKDE